MRRAPVFALMFLLLARFAAAEIPCQCNQTECTCFIQLGDEGPAVEFIQNALISQGYLSPGDDASSYDEFTYQAVIRFQQQKGLSPTGMMDDDTLTLLLWGMLPDELTAAKPGSSVLVMWIPTDGGKRHHDKEDCSGMHDPRLVSQRNALAMDMLHCGRCKPAGYVNPTK